MGISDGVIVMGISDGVIVLGISGGDIKRHSRTDTTGKWA